MSISYYLSRINHLEQDIADLHKRIADEHKNEADKNRKIASIQSAINKGSTSLFNSRQRQIQSLENDIYNIKKKIASYYKQIADKTADLGKMREQLRRVEEGDRRRIQKEQLNAQRRLQDDINTQKQQLDFLITRNYSSKEIADEENTDQKEFDFFISHASEDKEEIVRVLATALKGEGLNVWYDEFELKIGDSLRKKIDEGLTRSKYGIVIISPHFVKKNWTEYELNGMVAREMNGHKVILPIWHKITKDEVLNYSPTLADKLALNTAIHSVAEITQALKQFT